MEICQKCGTMMLPLKSGVGFVCPRCKSKLKVKAKPLIKERIEKPKPAKKLAKEIVDTLPKTEIECRKCGNKEAFYWIQQVGATNSGEESPDVQFFRCTKCSYTWREEV